MGDWICGDKCRRSVQLMHYIEGGSRIRKPHVCISQESHSLARNFYLSHLLCVSISHKFKILSAFHGELVHRHGYVGLGIE